MYCGNRLIVDRVAANVGASTSLPVLDVVATANVVAPTNLTIGLGQTIHPTLRTRSESE